MKKIYVLSGSDIAFPNLEELNKFLAWNNEHLSDSDCELELEDFFEYNLITADEGIELAKKLSQIFEETIDNSDI